MPAILVNDVSPVVSYVATASQTLFAIPFEFFNVLDIVVERQGVILTYSPTPTNNNQYSVVGANTQNGGSITLGGSGANLSDKITIYRNVKIERLANYPETGPMAVRSLNAEQSKQIAMMQQLERDINRTISVPIDESSISLPSAGNRANKILTFDGSGNVVTFYSKSLLDNANLTPIANGGTGATTAAGARTNLGASILGSNLFTIANSAQVTFPRFNADSTVSSLSASEFRNAIGAGTGNGSVTSVVGTGTVNGLTLSGTISSTGSLTLGGALSVSGADFGPQNAKAFFVAPNDSAGTPTFRTILPSDIPTLNQNTTGNAANITGILGISNGGTAAITSDDARTNLGAAKSGINTDITALNNSAGIQAGSPTGGAKGAGTINATGLFVNGVAVGVSGGSVSSVAMTVPSFLSVTGSPITTSGTFAVSLSGTALPAQNGGTGLTSPGAVGNVLTSNGTGWVSGAAPSSSVAYPQNIQSGNYTLVLADAGKHIYSANTGAQTITIPTNASVAFPIGALVTIVNRGTNPITLSASGVSIFVNNFPVPLPSPQVQPNNSIQLLKTAENSWVSIIGNFTGSNASVTYLLVGGGGGGGRYNSNGSGGGGGGGGGFVTGSATLTGLTIYTVTVGAGGTASAATGDANGSSGGNSAFNSLTALGGGGGGGNNAGLAGGSGGGGWWLGGGGAGQQPASSSGGFGNAGGAGSYQSDFSRITGGSGGGAAGAANSSVNGSAHNGGAGKESTITGSSVFYAGGGAGGSTFDSGVGGIGGGGNGSATTGTNGGANTGGGAGSNANGGSGVVIISSAVAAIYTTGSPVVTTSGGLTIYTFTSSGTIAF